MSIWKGEGIGCEEMNLYFDVDEHCQETEQYIVVQCKDFITRDFR